MDELVRASDADILERAHIIFCNLNPQVKEIRFDTEVQMWFVEIGEEETLWFHNLIEVMEYLEDL